MGEECCGLFRAGDIACIIGDDTDHGSGLTQYSGLWFLVSRHFIHTAIAPPYAGLLAKTNRGTRPEFNRIDERTASLHRSATPERPVESTATFRLREPHYIDYHYSVVFLEEGVAREEYVELSWCNYMNAVVDPAIYFVSDGRWVREYSTLHGYKAMHYPTDLPRSMWERRPIEEYVKMGRPVPFHWSRSETTFDLPLYYGRVHKMVYLVMFDHYLDWRFFTSPTGGGGNFLGPGYHNPAWDWSWIITEPKPGVRYECNVRLVYKPYEGDQDVLEEYSKWEGHDEQLLEKALSKMGR